MLSLIVLLLAACIPPTFWLLDMHVAAFAWACIIYPSIAYTVYESIKTRTWPKVISAPLMKWGGKK